MIGWTKLISGKTTVSEALRHRESSSSVPPQYLQFTTTESPLVVWNMTRRCNLSCIHCYISATSKPSPGELSTNEAKSMLADLGEMKAPVILFSGGEPLMRRDIFELGKFATDVGLRVVLSSNGVLIKKDIAGKLKNSGFEYAGISLDGMEKTHDSFRKMKGAFKLAINGIKNCLSLGIKAGVRITITKKNLADLPGIFDLVEKEGVPRLCIYNLVYSGRGKDMVSDDITKRQRRKMAETILAKVLDWSKRDVPVEVLTTDNHADGVFLLNWIKENQPQRLTEVKELILMHGGCSAGKKIGCIDYDGNVHPCQFWTEYSMGNVKSSPFSVLWKKNHGELICRLRSNKKKLHGKCGKCKFISLCGGCRLRAEVFHNDLWGEDPSCYLTLKEVSA